MDYVINHTSDQHKWFLESRSSRDNPKRDWYVWRDGKGETATDKGQPPNNWQSWFGHSAWQWDEKTRQYYYHYFYVQQPDLNWRNPEVHDAMDGVLDFWMKRGVAGFRIDAVSRLYEDPEMRDDPYLPGHNAYGDRNIQHKYTDDLPQVHDVLKEVRSVVDKYPGDPVLVTEADEPNVQALAKMYGNGDEVQLPMDFQIADVNELSAPRFRELFNQIENNSAHGQPEYFFSNHDQPRQWDRYGDGVHNDQIAKLMAVLELTTRGTPQMYTAKNSACALPILRALKMSMTPSASSAGPRKKAATANAHPCSGTLQSRQDSPPRASRGCRFRPALLSTTLKPKERIPTRSSIPTSNCSPSENDPPSATASQVSIDNDTPTSSSTCVRWGQTVLVASNMSNKQPAIPSALTSIEYAALILSRTSIRMGFARQTSLSGTLRESMSGRLISRVPMSRFETWDGKRSVFLPRLRDWP